MACTQLFTLTFLVITIIASFSFANGGVCTMTTDVEDTQHPGSIMYRSRASQGRTVLLKRGQHIEVPITTYSLCSISIQNVTYSNHGGRDSINVDIDGESIGRFQTTSTNDWNRFLATGYIGSESNVVKGQHTLELVFASGDEYGVEIDQVWLRFQCTSECGLRPSQEPDIYPYSCTTQFEAEYAKTTGKQKDRSSASNRKTVELQEGEYIQSAFTVDSHCTLQFTNIVYSNDGGADIVRVYVDDDYVGNFQTRAKSDYGALWNVMIDSGQVGTTAHISSTLTQYHTIKLFAFSTDSYGIEIDLIDVTLTCAKRRCPLETDIDADSTINTPRAGDGSSYGGIVVLASVVGSICMILPLLCVVCCCACILGGAFSNGNFR